MPKISVASSRNIKVLDNAVRGSHLLVIFCSLTNLYSTFTLCHCQYLERSKLDEDEEIITKLNCTTAQQQKIKLKATLFLNSLLVLYLKKASELCYTSGRTSTPISGVILIGVTPKSKGYSTEHKEPNGSLSLNSF